MFVLLLPPRAWTAAYEQLADTKSSYWINLAKTGNPNGAGLPTWPAWDNTAPKVLHFTPEPTVGEVANLEQLEAIDVFFQHARE